MRQVEPDPGADSGAHPRHLLLKLGLSNGKSVGFFWEVHG